ncbi:hypothetical protein ACETT8_004487 [Yersinia enterocolitica]
MTGFLALAFFASALSAIVVFLIAHALASRKQSSNIFPFALACEQRR